MAPRRNPRPEATGRWHSAGVRAGCPPEEGATTDGGWFDDLARTLARETGTTRRGVLKAAAGAALGGLPAAGGRSAVAACQPLGGVCLPHGRCCDGECDRALHRCLCPAGTIPYKGACCDRQPNGGSCSANGDCCSGICQGYVCYATVAGNCPAGASTCGGNVASCADVNCACYHVGDGATVCGQFAYCHPSCDGLPAGFWCLPSGDECCGSEHTWIAPCPAETCFTGETRVALADGTSKPIAEIAVGDRVLGQGGVNTVLAVARPRLGERRLYALNGSAFFVTAAHPFLTEDGWKAIDPAPGMAERLGLPLGRLAVGDRLLALAGAAAPALAGAATRGDEALPHLAPVPLRSIVGIPRDPATPLFDLRVSGDHTYVAGDLLVHNKE